MTAWPLASLPDAPLDGSFSQTPVPSFVDDRPDIGAARRRARFTRTLRRFAFRYLVTTAQKDALDTFYYTTTSGGVASFDWDHPDTGETLSVRFTADGYQISHRTAAEQWGDLWDANIALEEV